MATVRFSDQLKSDIKRKAEDLFTKRLEAADANVPEEITGKIVYDLMFKDHLRAMAALPEGYITTSNNFTLNGMKGKGVPDGITKRAISFDMPDTTRWPQTMDATIHGLTDNRRGSYSSMYINTDDERWTPAFVRAYVDYCQAYDTVMDDRIKFVEGVNAVITTFSTLAPALKEWPALWDLLPSEAQERHKKIVERVKRVVNLQGDPDHADQPVDLDSMTAAVTVAKLTR